MPMKDYKMESNEDINIDITDNNVENTTAEEVSSENIVELATEMASSEVSSDDVSEATPHSKEYHNWFMLHTYSGFEMRVEKQINEMRRTFQDDGLIHEVLLPTEQVIELGKNGQKRTSTRKLFPGYLMVQMTMTDFSWHLVQSIPKVTGFVGGRNRPAPMGSDDVRRILTLVQEGQDNPGPKVKYDVGDDVRVIDGPFGGFNGIVEDVNHDKGKLRVSVSIFGRQTPVELGFVQVTKG